MSKLFTENEVERFIEKAYNNGIAEAGMAQARSGFISDAKDYKNSTAYYEFKIERATQSKQDKDS